MPSTPTPAVEPRRRFHRRQNSTPNIEVGHLRKAPGISSKLARANSHRVHRRGLSLDQHRPLQTPQRLTPTLGPISQDDLSVSNNRINTNIPGPSPQYRNTAVAQTGLAQPGKDQFQQIETTQSQPLPHLHTKPFLPQDAEHQFDNISPHSSAPQPFLSSIPLPRNVVDPALTSHSAHAPSPSQLEELERHIKSVYGPYGDVYINILPTPVATPRKQATHSVDNVDISPIPLGFETGDMRLEPSTLQDFKPNLHSPSSDFGYESSFYSSPAHSVSCSPEQPSISTFADERFSQNSFGPPISNATSQYTIADTAMFSSQTTLADVEIADSPDGSMGSPRAVSIANLSIDGTVEDTGISAEEVASYISPQDPSTHRWTCLFPGCQSKTFGRRENIRSHVQTHLGDRQYRCNHCSKCFVRQHDLKRHAKIHSGNKPYKCPCGGGFARQDALTRHRQRGMCIGGFPNAVRKQARRGRPRKVRPEMAERIEKARKTREREQDGSRYASSASGAGSGPEDSPSPQCVENVDAIDTAKFLDMPEDANENDNFSMDPRLLAHSPASHDEYTSPFDVDAVSTSPAHPTAAGADNIFRLSGEVVLAETPPASPPAISANIHSPHGSTTSPVLPHTPPPSQHHPRSTIAIPSPRAAASSGTTSHAHSFRTTPPTSPLCGPDVPLAPATTCGDELGGHQGSAGPRADHHPTVVDVAVIEDFLALGGADDRAVVTLDPMGINFPASADLDVSFNYFDNLKADVSVCGPGSALPETDEDPFCSIWNPDRQGY